MLPGVRPPAPMLRGVRLPVITGTNQIATSGVGAINMPMPAGVQEGDLLAIFVIQSAGSARNMSIPTGWQQLYNEVGPLSARRCGGFWKFAGASEPATHTVSTGSSGSWTGISCKIEDAAGIEAATHQGTDAIAPCPALAPSWADDGSLWLSVCHKVNDTGEDTPPDGFDVAVTRSGGGGNINRMTLAQRAMLSDEMRPGPFELLSSNPMWVTATLAVRPVS